MKYFTLLAFFMGLISSAPLLSMSTNISLIKAARKGKYTSVQRLLAQKVNLETKDAHGSTALIEAISNGHHHIAQALITAGATMHAQNNYGDTPLITAACTGYEPLVQQCIAAQVDLNTKDNEGITALGWAAIRRHPHIVKILLAAGADVHTRDNQGNTSLILAVGLRAGDRQVVQALLDANIALNVRGKEGKTALGWAIYGCHWDLARLLIAQGADVTIPSNNGHSPLIEASDGGYTSLVGPLLDAGACINQKDSDGKTALMYAATAYRINMARTLIAEGALFDTTLENYATYANFTQNIELLFACSRAVFTPLASKGALTLALRTLNQLVTIHLIRLDYRDAHGNTPLHYAVLGGNRVMIGLLVHLMIKYQQFDALYCRNRKEKLVPIEMAVAKNGPWLLQPFFEALHRHTQASS